MKNHHVHGFDGLVLHMSMDFDGRSWISMVDHQIPCSPWSFMVTISPGEHCPNRRNSITYLRILAMSRTVLLPPVHLCSDPCNIYCVFSPVTYLNPVSTIIRAGAALLHNSIHVQDCLVVFCLPMQCFSPVVYIYFFFIFLNNFSAI